MSIAIDTAGLHPATELCLEALQWLQDWAFQNGADIHSVLDMGCGNGILSLVSASVWEASVLAADISPRAVEDARKNIAAHGLEAAVSAVRSEGFTAPAIVAHAPYDLILFNVLAEIVVRMGAQVASHLAEGGIAILGGILVWQAEEVRVAYQGLGFEIIHQMERSPWHLLILRKQKPAL